MQTSLRGIARKAKQNKNHRFGNLYRLLNKDALYLAWKEINKKAATGVDKETAKEFEKNLSTNLDTIVGELKGKKYKARLVKRVYIPKGNGKTRPLGLPALRDKIVQKAVANILEAIYEQDFLKCSYGYRPRVGAQKAVKDLNKELMQKYSYIVEADIRSYFDNNEKTSFEFLGFEYRWAVSNKGKDTITRRTSRSRLRKSIKAFTIWSKENRHSRIKRIVEMLNSKFRGYFNYYGVIGNSKGINQFYEEAMKILYKWLNRRSQRKSFTWDEFDEKMKWYGLITPKVVERPDNQVRIEACFA